MAIARYSLARLIVRIWYFELWEIAWIVGRAEGRQPKHGSVVGQRRVGQALRVLDIE